ncbi:Uncharacterized protein BP5553_10245 [Venustampulla echinocandica]|uniref:Ubiquinol-cytochrome-c reductase cytochrome c1 n=1 Tax=Venustampulla echinocandica TaxID=2656787 RepID=A0A370T9M3_9HELO|nr:Uncharacterized protein BP5553_10245 [Venustampulla echinocandica]RDL30367.1 Uncharacterized protein BP5553_10245 [Venustampulla echinocandica]
MAKNPPDERLVYLALKNVFKGPDAQLRIPKKIRKLIQKQLENGHAELRALVAEHNINNVCNVAKALLQDSIFSSTLRAKIRFPEVFEVSPAQSAERVASEAEAARSDADAIRDAAEGLHGPRASVKVDELDSAHKGKRKALGIITGLNFSISKAFLPTYERLCSVIVPSVLASQYSAQTSGEDVLQTKGWDCPESVELNIWARIFCSNEDKFDAEKLDQLGKPFPEFLDSIAQLRHTAVHRVRVSANTVRQFMIEAEFLADILHDNICARTLSCLRREVQQVVDELGRNKDLLESRLTEKLQDIDTRRRELDSLERKAVEEILREDKEYQTLASMNLEQAINIPENAQDSTSTPEHETSSEADVDVECFKRADFGQSGEIV